MGWINVIKLFLDLGVNLLSTVCSRTLRSPLRYDASVFIKCYIVYCTGIYACLSKSHKCWVWLRIAAHCFHCELVLLITM